MKTEAMVLDRHGGPEVLERRELEIADAGPREVLVRVRSAAVGWVDLLMSSGQYQHLASPPYVPGLESTGEVVAAGAEARRRADCPAADDPFEGLAERLLVLGLLERTPQAGYRLSPAGLPLADHVAKQFLALSTE